MTYLTTTELSKKWNISSRKIAYYCEVGRISGAVKKATLWLIPADAQRPIDKRKAKSTVFDVDKNIAEKGILSVNNKVENDTAADVYYPKAIHKHFGLTRDILSNTIRAISFDKTGYTGSKICVIKKVTEKCRSRQELVLESGQCIYVITIKSPEDDTYSEKMFSAIQKWANERDVELKGIAYSFIRLLEENNRRVLYEIWIPIK